MTSPTCRPSDPPRTPANRLGLDYSAEAERFGPPPVPITDAHTHINGDRASRIYAKVCRLYGIDRVWSMTRLSDIDAVREALGGRVEFIAVPNWQDPDKGRAFQQGYLDDIRRYCDHGARVVKFWAAPRSRDLAKEFGDPEAMSLENPWRIKAMELATDLGMFFMAHIADPDTWFQTKYADSSFYGTKAQQYEALERVVDRFDSPWLIAHLGGWPEDLVFLSGLLERHDNVYLDTSATKWMIRELSRHPAGELTAFLTRWSGRLLFGSDIVTTDEHLGAASGSRGMGHLAGSEGEAAELYASRYWALRTLWETGYEGESNIADPDLMLVDPGSFHEMSAPRLAGKAVDPALLETLYRGAARSLMGDWRAAHG